MDFVAESSEPLELLKEGDSFYIGRKRATHLKYGKDGALLLGKISEQRGLGKQVYLDAISPHAIFVVGARGSGKCLGGDSDVQLADGRSIKIKDLEHNSTVLSLNEELKIEGAEKQGFYKREVDKTLILKLRSGKEIELTPEHPLLTVNGWVPAEELKEKDRIATPRKVDFFGKTKMKDNEVRLLAYLIAEGHLGNSFVIFSNFDKKITKEFTEDTISFDKNLRVTVHSKEGCYRVCQVKKEIDISEVERNSIGQFTSKSRIHAQKSSLMKWLIALGLYGKLSKEKHLPDEIMTLNKQQMRLFLNRLFSCDGSIYKKRGKTYHWQIDYSSSSKKLIYQVQSLLLRFGVLSKVRDRKIRLNGKTFESYEIIIDSESVSRFIKEIGFYGEKKEKAVLALEELKCIKFNPNVDTIPKEMWKSHPIKNWARLGRILEYSSPKSLRTAKDYSPSREKLLRISRAAGNNELMKLADSDVFWDEIKSIERQQKRTTVYDIGVSKNHNFIANDIIVHNSYDLGIMAEELVLKNPNVASVVIDPIGIFWSMKHPNKEEKELKDLSDWGLKPKGIENTQVFIPLGMKEKVPGETYDHLFSLKPSELTIEDWCLTFGLDRFSPSALLLEKAIDKAKEKYKVFSIDELMRVIELDKELTSKDRGYKQDTRRALLSRLEAANSWGIFSKDGTSLSEVCKEGYVSVVDISFLEENVASLVIGMLARKILNARKLVTRKASMENYSVGDIDDLLDVEIPPTWLFIDEAHTLMPSGTAKTAATDSLIEYVKQGRRPGCSLVFATQQPSAIDTRVLSQLDMLICHKLVFDEDLKAVMKRFPTSLPKEYEKNRFLKTLPIGIAMIGDRSEESNRAFIVRIRPRFSQHEGREIGAIKTREKLDINGLAEMIGKKLDDMGELSLIKVDEIVDTFKRRYGGEIDIDNVLDMVCRQKGAVREENRIVIPGFDKRLGAREELEKGQKAFMLRIDESLARQRAEKMRHKKTLGLFGTDERLKELKLVYEPVYKIKYELVLDSGGYKPLSMYVDSDYEFYYWEKGLKKTKDLKELTELDEKKMSVLRAVTKNGDLAKITDKTNLPLHVASKYLNEMIDIGLVEKKDDKYRIRKKIGALAVDQQSFIALDEKMSFTKPDRYELEEYEMDKKRLLRIPALFGKTRVKDFEVIFKPVWRATFESASGLRVEKIDAL
jgi:intein/homing endonuclease/predicted transcriptional regulator